MASTRIKERTTAERLQDYLRISLDTYEESRLEALNVYDLYHNRHYTNSQLSILRNRQQPAETFNIIKMYKRMMTGYLSTVINKIVVRAANIDDTLRASIGQDVVDYTLKKNNFQRLKTKLETDIILAGFCCFRVRGEDNGRLDEFGTKEKDLIVDHIPWDEIAIDPMSKKDDYSDAKYIHRWKWVAEEDLIALYGEKKVAELYENQNTEDIRGFDLTAKFNGSFVGRYNIYNNYLIVETQIKDLDGNIMSYVWSNDTILETNDLSHLDRFEYIPIKLEYSNTSEVYGVMRELQETQLSINQALIQIQLLINTNKVMVQEGAVTDHEEFRRQFEKVNSFMKVLDIDGIKIENVSGDIVNQYNVIANALDRCQKITGMNDSFLGFAGSSASGRQVKLQQNSAVVALRYLTETLEFAYKELGESILRSAKVYFKAHQYIRVTDKKTGDKWTEINRPITIPNELGEEQPVFYDNFVYDEDTDEVYISPIIDPDSQLQDLEYDLDITTAVYNDTDDIERLTLEAILSGPAGNTLKAVSPGDYLEISGMHIQSLKGRNSEDIAQIFYANAAKIKGLQPEDPRQIEGNPGGSNGQAPQLLSAMGATNDAQQEGFNNARN